MSRLEKEKKVGFEAVWQASFVAKKMQDQLKSLLIISKDDFSPVTLADFSIQALINLHLFKAFPDIPIMGEEDSVLLQSLDQGVIKGRVAEHIEEFFPNIREEDIFEAIDRGGFTGAPKGRFWVLDPIDGTRGFINNEQYAIALALIEDGEVILSFLGCPKLYPKKFQRDGIFVACKNEGCTFFPFDKTQKQEVHVNSNENLSHIVYCEPHVSSKTHSHALAFEIMQHVHENPHSEKMDSQCKYAIVASGDASVYLRIPIKGSYKEKIWDHAPGLLIVEEAGGKVTDLDGKKIDCSVGETLINNRGILATNGMVHEEMLKAIAKVEKSRT